ncbi:putative Late nodulin [Medicago truncatula]|uniref:Putative Late nodulin n=1 Tax=Medicago truncatula TaxID=3880 RepID=A0A396HCW8_MEDTR|nr:putative Late nodulin [Medicago truncatula]
MIEIYKFVYVVIFFVSLFLVVVDSGKRIGGENRHRQCVDDHDCYKIFSCPREIAFKCVNGWCKCTL